MSFAGPEKWIDTDDVFSRADCGSHRDFYPNIDIPRTFRHPQGIFSTFSYSSYPTISQILQLLDVADSNAGWGFCSSRGARIMQAMWQSGLSRTNPLPLWTSNPACKSLTVSGFEIGKGVLCRAPMVSLICDHESPIRKALLLIFLRSLAFGLLLLYDWYMEAKVPSLSISTCKFCLRASGR